MNALAPRIIADLLFAYISKDEMLPQFFEIQAFEEGLLYLQEHYLDDTYNLKAFEDYLNKMNDIAETSRK